MRRSQLGQVLAMGTLLAVCLISCNSASQAAEALRLSEKNWDDATPEGKEVDAIYGDWVLRNEHLVAVIGEAIESRNANMTVRNVGGSVIDLTQRAPQSDQLSALTIRWALATNSPVQLRAIRPLVRERRRSSRFTEPRPTSDLRPKWSTNFPTAPAG